MPEPLSVIGLATIAGYTALNIYARGAGAVSSESTAARKAAKDVIELVEKSHALFGDKAVALSQLTALADECVREGERIDQTAILITESFIRALPDGFPLPDFAAEPDGSVSLDWFASRTRQFTISIGSSHRLAYAWLDGSDKGHAVAAFDGGRVPRMILEGILGIMNNGNASIRAA
jgi:hypothetical protein